VNGGEKNRKMRRSDWTLVPPFMLGLGVCIWMLSSIWDANAAHVLSQGVGIPGFEVGVSVRDAWPACAGSRVVTNRSFSVLDGPRVVSQFPSPITAPNSGWRFAESASGLIATATGASRQNGATFVRRIGSTSWDAVFSDTPRRAGGTVAAFDDYFALIGGQDAFVQGRDNDVFLANATTLATIGSLNMSEGRTASVFAHVMDTGYLIITGGVEFTTVDTRKSDGTWLVDVVEAQPRLRASFASTGSTLFFAGGMFYPPTPGPLLEVRDIGIVTGLGASVSVRREPLAFGLRDGHATVAGGLFVLAGGVRLLPMSSSQTDPAAPSRIQTYDLQSGIHSTYESVLPDIVTKAVCGEISGQWLYVFSDQAMGYAINISSVSATTTTTTTATQNETTTTTTTTIVQAMPESSSALPVDLTIGMWCRMIGGLKNG